MNGDGISNLNKFIGTGSEREGDKSNMIRKVIIWPENSMKPKPKEHKEGKIVDWLKEQRIKNEEDRKNGHVT